MDDILDFDAPIAWNWSQGLILRKILRSIEVGTGKWSCFGRSEGFGSSELKEIVNFGSPNRIHLRLTNGAGIKGAIRILAGGRSRFGQ